MELTHLYFLITLKVQALQMKKLVISCIRQGLFFKVTKKYAIAHPFLASLCKLTRILFKKRQLNSIKRESEYNKAMIRTIQKLSHPLQKTQSVRQLLPCSILRRYAEQ